MAVQPSMPCGRSNTRVVSLADVPQAPDDAQPGTTVEAIVLAGPRPPDEVDDEGVLDPVAGDVAHVYRHRLAELSPAPRDTLPAQ